MISNNRILNSSRNIAMGTVNRIISFLTPFVMRTLIIKILGEGYLGINGLFSSILSVLNIAELGLASAIGACMYKPIAEGDIDTVSALLRLLRKFYRYVGVILILSGLCVMPFLPKLINGNPPEDVNIYLLFTLYLLQTVFGYIFYGYKITLITAHQRMDAVEIVSIFCKIATFVAQIIAIIALHNIQLYVALNLCCTIANNLWCAYRANKMYPQYKCEGVLSRELVNPLKKNIFALALLKIGNTASTTLDTVIISIFLGLSPVAVYGNYNSLGSAIASFLILAFGAITASVGNSIVIDSKQKNYADFEKFSFINTWIVGWCSICLLCITQVFMEIWMGESLMLGNSALFSIVLCFYMKQTRTVVQTYKDAAGMWWADKFKPLVGGVLNLILNVVLIQTIGIAGVVLSTAISYLLVEIPWETHVLFKRYFNQSEKAYYLELGRMTIYVAVAGAVTYGICSLLYDGLIGLLLRMLVCMVVPNAILFLLNHNRKICHQAINLVHRALTSMIKRTTNAQ